MSLIQDYFLKTELYIKEYGEKTLVFIQVGSFYEVYGKKEKDRIRILNNKADILQCKKEGLGDGFY